jgi:hypothetical protein
MLKKKWYIHSFSTKCFYTVVREALRGMNSKKNNNKQNHQRADLLTKLTNPTGDQVPKVKCKIFDVFYCQ